MLMVLDIGNTNVTIGIFDGDKLRVTWRLATHIRHMPDEYAAMLLNLLQHEGIKTSDISEVAMCSVVPPLVGTFDEICRRYFGIQPLTIGPGTKTGVRIRLDNPREAGTDRIVNAAAAHHLYGGPIIIVDMGTATTFDAVSKEGDYLGGAIAPGIVISAEALFTRTAALPRVELARPKRAVGTNSVTAMQSGIIFGYVGLIEGVVNRMKQELEGKVMVIATGGYAPIIARETTAINKVDADLTLIGLRLIYLMNKAQPGSADASK